MENDFELGLSYDDVLIKPLPSKVNSRDEVDISVELSDSLTLKFPLIASPMANVVNGYFAHLLSELGGMAILHRFYQSRDEMFQDIITNLLVDDIFGMSLKVDEDNFEEYFDYEPSVVVVDTANGYTERLLKYITIVKNYISKNNINCLLMSGNVATPEGANNLYNAGCDIVRMLIGTGSVCSTSNQTGIGVPSISALQSIPENRDYKIIADGGIKYTGDIVKAIVAGADCCMSGKLFGECFESPNEGLIYGMASRFHQESMKGNIKSVEGINTPIEKKQSLEQFVRESSYAIKSAGTYLNARNLQQMYLNGRFIRVTNSAIKKL